jgi:hypothetical protein
VLEGAARLAEVVAGLQRPDVGLDEAGSLGKLFLDPVEVTFPAAVEHPEGHAQGKEVLRAIFVFGG